MEVTTDRKPAAVKLWRATNPDARDFRLESLGPKWESSTLAATSEGRYLATVPKPPQGWTAFFVELTYPSGTIVPMKLTTEVRVLPDVLPYKFEPRRPVR
jgi:PhoPQ-activated pathogenicity-related protein